MVSVTPAMDRSRRRRAFWLRTVASGRRIVVTRGRPAGSRTPLDVKSVSEVCRRKPRGRGLQRGPAVRLGPDVMFDGGRLRAHRRWHWPPSPGRTSAWLARARCGHARGRRRSLTAVSETTRQSSAQATSRPRRRRSLRPSAECQSARRARATHVRRGQAPAARWVPRWRPYAQRPPSAWPDGAEMVGVAPEPRWSGAGVRARSA
jgi:hypothetical protein